MLALDLLPPPPDRLTPGAAGRRVAAALAEAAVLRDHDGELNPVTSDDPADFRRAHQVRAAWRGWLDEAEPLLRRLRDVPGLDPAAVLDLQSAVTRAGFVVRRSPEEMKRRYDRVMAGEYVTMDELREQLRRRKAEAQ